MSHSANDEQKRRECLHTLANAQTDVLAAFWDDIDVSIEFCAMRKPEIGLAMLRGRSDGSGRPFNLGEATICRCVLAMPDTSSGVDIMGVEYVLGRNQNHALHIAKFDALFQDSTLGAEMQGQVLPELRDHRASHIEETARKSDSTRVEFFTMTRGE
jgi:alpha-D-ribose 1-methylphosphonate 5-triphosphate synthase subunit PhnG